jgi:hypothetical protein
MRYTCPRPTIFPEITAKPSFFCRRAEKVLQPEWVCRPVTGVISRRLAPFCVCENAINSAYLVSRGPEKDRKTDKSPALLAEPKIKLRRNP